MKSDYLKINLVPYFNNSWNVQLNEFFRLKLKEIAKQKFTIKRLSILTKKSIDSIWKFHQGRFNANLGYLLKLCALLNIPKKRLVDNIIAVYPKARKSFVKIKELEINPKFVEWYGAWIGEGDHSENREIVSLTNYSIEMLKLHMEMLIILGFKKEMIKAEITSPYKESDDAIRRRWSKILDLSINQITTINHLNNASQEGARVEVFCAAFFRILHDADREIKDIIKKSNDDTKMAYIKGIFAAEGSVRKKAKQIRLNMKDKKEIYFAKSILKEVGISTMSIKLNKSNQCYELSIFGFDNIKRFKDIKGFGLNKKRSKILEENFKTYENKLPYHIRFKRVEKILSKKKRISNNELAKIFKLHPRHVAYITRNFTKKRLLKVDKSSKIYKYSLK